MDRFSFILESYSIPFNGADRPVWKHTIDSKFVVKACYNLINLPYAMLDNFIGSTYEKQATHMIAFSYSEAGLSRI